MHELASRKIRTKASVTRSKQEHPHYQLDRRGEEDFPKRSASSHRLRRGRFRATSTVTACPSSSEPPSSVMARSASSLFDTSTYPKPRGMPRRPRTTSAVIRGAYEAKKSLKLSSVTLFDKLPTYRRCDMDTFLWRRNPTHTFPLMDSAAMPWQRVIVQRDLGTLTKLAPSVSEG